ncbi:DUF6929 family protein [Chitinophaga pinensis]|uniref:Uncharacterized protein n=1 Tax=Chitinophaga pinensis (strain ATCC 43595 / DSM 2588 / LMG 13176 / NBRC 15968 / NCIMB 11800 / UQM 2034) TaxID=485918 RepID=A0A979GAJ1_CHIPD|nr:hypothetical protein [Chitinophaga pinensis]ACU63762.1 hypothetical protein Cpin_6358 [Chitinophaga pinensis DSM 2588]
MKTIITLLKFLLLSEYPSGSAISYYKDQLYIIGDDASTLLVLDSNYHEVRTVPFFHYNEKRIPKAQKADLETAVIIGKDGQKNLLALGSAATREREQIILYPLDTTDSQPTYISSTSFIQRLQQIPEINIEGATLAGQHLILSNRGNESNPINHLIITTPDFWQYPEKAPLHISAINIPFALPGFAGISELCYIEQEDLLLVLLSSEATGNAYDDGAIGDSYIAWVTHFNEKLNIRDICLDGITNLSEIDPAFKGEKMEGICIAAVKNNEWYLHLVADNDKGASKIFYIKMAPDQLHPYKKK